LKGADETLYSSIAQAFDIKLVPIIITNCSGYEGVWNDYSVHPVNEVSGNAARRSTGKVTYIVTGLEQLIELECTEFIEYTGNEAQEGIQQYFTSAMVISMIKAKPAAGVSNLSVQAVAKNVRPNPKST